MKLYYAPGACSLAPHIVIQELGLPYTPVKVDLRSHKLADGTDFYSINPHGYVPVLELDDGTRLTEAQVLLQYLADRKPGTLAPVFGGIERYKLMETLGFIASEVHKGFGPLWHPETPEATRAGTIAKLGKRFDEISRTLTQREFIYGNSFSVADAYLYTVGSWSGYLKVDMSKWPAVQQYLARIGERESVRKAKSVESTKAAAAA
jgi:glutathione S-transferase